MNLIIGAGGALLLTQMHGIQDSIGRDVNIERVWGGDICYSV